MINGMDSCFQVQFSLCLFIFFVVLVADAGVEPKDCIKIYLGMNYERFVEEFIYIF